MVGWILHVWSPWIYKTDRVREASGPALKWALCCGTVASARRWSCGDDLQGPYRVQGEGQAVHRCTFSPFPLAHAQVRAAVTPDTPVSSQARCRRDPSLGADLLRDCLVPDSSASHTGSPQQLCCEK